MTAPTPPMPPVGEAQTLEPGLRRILAPNPSPMTHWGTNTYLLGEEALAVIDPGPDDDAHLAAILRSVGQGQQISHILVTHAHLDHSPLAARLSAQTGAPVLAFGDHLAGRSAVMQDLAASGFMRGGEGVDQRFRPDIVLHDGEVVEGAGWQLTVHHTPGHFGNHLSFAWGRVLFTGDLVMGWASSLISPPDGDLTDFMASCRALRDLGPVRLHAGHGAPVKDPAARLDWLIGHRLSREASILRALAEGPADAASLTARIYTDTPENLLPAARRNVLAHLVDLHQRRAAQALGPLTANTRFRLEQGRKFS